MLLFFDYLVEAMKTASKQESPDRRDKDNGTDSGLIQACINGNEQAQFELYERYHRTLFGVCMRYCRNREDAQDVLQESFVDIFKKLKEYRFEGSAEGWMKRILVGKAIDYHRKSMRMQPYIHSDSELLASPQTIDPAEQRDTAHHIAAALQQLPDRSRLVFNLFAIEGYSHKEIAKELNIDEGTSKSQLAYARKKLQKQLQPHL